MARWQYQPYTEPLFSVPATIDHWSPRTNEPTRRLTPVTALIAMAVAFVPVVAPAAPVTIHGAQGGGGVARPDSRQYQGLAGPVLVPVAGETITIDKWGPQRPDSIARGLRIPAGFTVGPLVVPDVTQPVPLRSWAPQYPERIASRSVTPAQIVAPLHVPDVTALVPTQSWAPTYPDRALARARTVPLFAAQPVEPVAAAAPDTTAFRGVQGGGSVASIRLVQYQAVAAPVLVPVAGGEVLTADKWAPRYPDRLERARPVPGFWVAPLHVPDVTVVAAARSWAPVYPDRGRVVSRAPVFPLAVAPLLVPDVTSPSPARSWAPTYPDRVSRTRQASVGVVVQNVAPIPPAAETITVDKWLTRYELPRRVRFDANGISSIEWAIIEDVPDFRLAVFPDRLHARRALALPTTVGPLFVPAPVVAPEQWTPQYPALAHAIPRTPGLAAVTAPLHVPDVTQPATARSWATQLPDAVSRMRRHQASATTFVPLVPAPVLEQWAPEYLDRVQRVRPPAFSFVVVPLYVADVTVVVPGQSWAPTYPDRVIARITPPWAGFVVGPLEPIAGGPATGDIVTTSNAYFRRVATSQEATVRRAATTAIGTVRRVATSENGER